MAISFTSSSALIPIMIDCPLIPRAVKVGSGIIGPPPSSKPSKSSLVVKAQRYDGEPKRDISHTPLVNQSDPYRMKAFYDATRYESAPWKIEEKGDRTEMWLKMPGVGVMDIYMYVKDNKLFIQERNDITPFRRMMIQPFESIQLPPDCKKEDIVAKLGNGVLYIYIPKMSKPESPYDIPVDNVSW